MFGKVVWGSGDRGHNRKLWSGRGLYLCPALSLSCPALKAIQIQIQLQIQIQIQTQIIKTKSKLQRLQGKYVLQRQQLGEIQLHKYTNTQIQIHKYINN